MEEEVSASWSWGGRAQDLEINQRLKNLNGLYSTAIEDVIEKITKHKVNSDFEEELARRKSIEMADFEKEIMFEAEQVMASVNQLVSQFRLKMFNKETKTGVLKRGVDEYTNCFKADIVTLRSLFEQDKKEWNASPEVALRLA